MSEITHFRSITNWVLLKSLLSVPLNGHALNLYSSPPLLLAKVRMPTGMITSRVCGRGNIFGSVCVSVCLCGFTQGTLYTTTTVYGVLVHQEGAICTTKVVGQGHRSKVKVVWGVLYPIDSREVQHAGVFNGIFDHWNSIDRSLTPKVSKEMGGMVKCQSSGNASINHSHIQPFSTKIRLSYSEYCLPYIDI